MPLNRTITILLFVAQLILSGSFFAQPVIVNKANRHYLQRIGAEAPNKLNPVGQQIIREYATALATNPANLNTYFQCEITQEFTLTEKGEAIVRYRVINGSVKGDVSLKGFNISEVLMPSVFNASILMSNSNGDTLLHEQLNSLSLTHGSSAHIRFRVEFPAQVDTVWVELKDMFFFHEKQDLQQLITRIQKVADYYASDYLLSNIQNLLSVVNSHHFDLLPQSFLSLLEADRVLQHIAESDFPLHLSLGIYDPANLQQRFEVATNTYNYLMREFRNTLRQAKRIYLTQTEQALVLKYIEGIIRYIDDNPQPGFAAAPFINQLSTIAFAGKEFEQKANYFRQIASMIYPGISEKEASSKLLTLVYNAMFLKAQYYIEAVDFNKAVVMLENAILFCQAFQEIECSEDAHLELSKAKHGLFGFYLSVAERAIEMQRPDIASSYVFLGREYQRNNSHLIIHDGKVTTMLIKLFDAWVLQAAKHNRSEHFDSATIVLNRVVQPDIGITPSAAWHSENVIALNGLLAESLNDMAQALDLLPLNASESMYHNLVRFIKYDMNGIELSKNNKSFFDDLQGEIVNQLEIAAGADFDQEYYEESMRKLLLSRSIIGDRKIEISPEIDSMSIIVGREVIKHMLRKAVTFIHQGEADKGFELYSLALKRSEEYGLDKDEITVAYLDDMYDAYLAIKCSHLQSLLDKTLIQAERLTSLKMFSLATDTLNVILNHLNEHKACKFSLSPARKHINKYQYPAAYLRSLQLADKALSRNDFLTCLRHIEHAEMLYRKHDLRQFSLEAFSMFDYAKIHQNTSLNWYIARRYVQLLNYEKVLSMLELLRTSGISSAQTSEIQEELGILMGNKDRTQVNFFQSFSKPRDYTGGYSWYKPFNRAYRRGLGYKFPWFF